MNPVLLSEDQGPAGPKSRTAPHSRVLQVSALLLLLGVALIARAQDRECREILHHPFNSLQTVEPQDLCRYRGEALLVVNTASGCAYTDQHGGLEARRNGLAQAGEQTGATGGNRS